MEQKTKGNEAVAGSKLEPGLYVTATPIGNMGDITLRALEALRAADVIACEDTRRTGRLLARYDIKRPLIAYHDHNEMRMHPVLIERLIAGELIVLVSDAGTPLVSDPGYRLVRAAREHGVFVTALPGASSVLAALSVAGLPVQPFLFTGFLPARQGARRREATRLAAIDATLVLFESARRLPASLADLAAAMGPRAAAVARELTKLHEEVRRGSLADLAAGYAFEGPPKGEVVLVIAPRGSGRAAAPSEAEIDALLGEALRTRTPSRAAAAVAVAAGLPRRAVYARALALRRGSGAA